jgi:hypothetical protein
MIHTRSIWAHWYNFMPGIPTPLDAERRAWIAEFEAAVEVNGASSKPKRKAKS